MPDRGAHFRRCDFQVHTPRDANWSGPRPSTDDERERWAEEFVLACRNRGLEAIAITDHHDMLMIPYVRDAARAETGLDGAMVPTEQRLTVFPGIELTLGVPCQALLVLDAELPDKRLADVMSALSIQQVDTAEQKLPDVEPLDQFQSLQDVHTRLDEHGFRGRYVLLPNVTDRGHQTLMRKGMAVKYREMPCIGGYLDGSVDKLGNGASTILAGRDVSWGNKPLAVIQTSDSRSADFSTLGDPSTWIKWAEPTAEALRQACLAHESRISYSEPQLPAVTLTRLSVSNSKFLGPVELQFNPQYNSIIGGRGTGKSTILDYIRWALCDQPSAMPEDAEVGDPRVRQRRLVDATLKPFDASVDVRFVLNDIPHLVRRHSSDGRVELKIGDEEFRDVREQHIRDLLPIQAYSQKQLSSVAVRLDELTRFIALPIRRQLAELDEQIEDAATELRDTHLSLQKHRRLSRAIDQAALKERSLAEQASNIRASLHGLSEDDQAVLARKPHFDQHRSTYAELSRVAQQGREIGERFIEGVEQAVEALPEMGEESDEAVKALMRDYRQRLMTALAALRESAAHVVEDYASASVEVDPELEAALTTFEETYTGVKARSTAHESQLQELSDLEGQLESGREQLRAQREERRGLGEPATALEKAMENYFDLIRARSDILESECVRISELSNGLIRATLGRGLHLEGLADALIGAVTGSGLRKARVEELFDNLAATEDPLTTWAAVLRELENLAAADEDAEFTTEDAPTLTRLGFRVSDVGRVAEQLGPDGWLAVATTKMHDRPHFQYETRDGDYIDFEVASAGQQATALMRVLLAQMGPPLIIDQPEDDLDSQVVQSIVEQVWQAKTTRQIIFASHNANIVVNGDAELVACCDYRVAGDQSGGQIKLVGAIDVPTVRQEITSVMEGGEKAFKLRKDKYGF